MRMRKLLVILIPIALVLLVVAVIVAGSLSNSVSATSQNGHASRNGPVSHMTQKIHTMSGPDRGFSFIKPHLHPAYANEPTYTAADVEKYVLAAGNSIWTAGSRRSHNL